MEENNKAKDGQVINKRKKKQAEIEPAMDEINNMEDLDKITPQGFTRMIMKNQVGGFAIGKVFSDLRYTLQNK